MTLLVLQGESIVKVCVKRVRERSNIIFRGGRGGLLKPSECRHMGEGDITKSSYNFYRGWKSL